MVTSGLIALSIALLIGVAVKADLVKFEWVVPAIVVFGISMVWAVFVLGYWIGS